MVVSSRFKGHGVDPSACVAFFFSLAVNWVFAPVAAAWDELR